MPGRPDTAFLLKVSQDAALREKLRAAKDADGVVAVAVEAGFGDLSASIRAEVAKHQEVLQAKRAELSDQELELFTNPGLACCAQTSIYSGGAL